MSSASSRADAPSAVTGLLIIRVWLEPEHPVTLRARITQSVSVDPDTKPEPRPPRAGTITVASTEEALEAVRAWLEGLVGDQPAV